MDAPVFKCTYSVFKLVADGTAARRRRERKKTREKSRKGSGKANHRGTETQRKQSGGRKGRSEMNRKAITGGSLPRRAGGRKGGRFAGKGQFCVMFSLTSESGKLGCLRS